MALSGTGAAAPNPQLTVNPASLSFGSVTVNTATTKTVTLTSSGTSDLTVNAASITGAGFSIVAGSLPATLSPGQSISLTVQFKPTTTGTLSRPADYQQRLHHWQHSGGSQRHRHGGTKSATHGQHDESRFWQRYGEHGNDQDCDADVVGHLRL